MGKFKGDKKGKHLREEEEEENEEESDQEEEEEGEEEDDDEDNEGLLLNMDELPRAVRNRVVAMKKLQEDADGVDEEYKQERMALERKYIARRQTIYENRRQIINGDVEVPDVPLEEGEEPAAAAEEEEPAKGIPEFWNTILAVHPAINEYIAEDDIPVLSKLTDISCSYAEDFTSFTLSFQFAENDYFSNSVLTKKYEVMPDLLDDQAPTLKSTEGCEIQWKSGKNLCEEEITKKQRAKSGRNKGQVRTITVKKPKRSFFHYFSPMTNQVEAEEDEDDEEGGKGPEEPVDKDGNPVKIDPESDYDIGHVIRTSLIPQAINWFTGEAALEYDAMFGYDGEDDEEDDGEDDGEEDDEEEDDEEEDEAPKGKKQQTGGNKKGGKGAAGAAGEEKPAECKQN